MIQKKIKYSDEIKLIKNWKLKNENEEKKIILLPGRLTPWKGQEMFIEALNKLTERYHKNGKKLHLQHLSEDCARLLTDAKDIVDVHYWEDPKYKVAADTLS